MEKRLAVTPPGLPKISRQATLIAAFGFFFGFGDESHR